MLELAVVVAAVVVITTTTTKSFIESWCAPNAVLSSGCLVANETEMAPDLMGLKVEWGIDIKEASK